MLTVSGYSVGDDKESQSFLQVPLKTTIVAPSFVTCRTRAEGYQGRADAIESDAIGDVVVDHLLQRLQIVCSHLRQFLRSRVPLHDAADLGVGCADVKAGVTDAHSGPPLGFLFDAFGFLGSVLVSFAVILQQLIEHPVAVGCAGGICGTFRFSV